MRGKLSMIERNKVVVFEEHGRGWEKDSKKWESWRISLAMGICFGFSSNYDGKLWMLLSKESDLITFFFLMLAASGLHCSIWPSPVVAHGLSCPSTCRILVPWLGMEPTSLALEGGFLTTGHPGKSPFSFLKDFFFLSASFKGALPLSSVLHYFCWELSYNLNNCSLCILCALNVIKIFSLFLLFGINSAMMSIGVV